jgi:hypothetical protein
MGPFTHADEVNASIAEHLRSASAAADIHSLRALVDHVLPPFPGSIAA